MLRVCSRVGVRGFRVTRESFQRDLPVLQAVIGESDFVAFDFELTGLLKSRQSERFIGVDASFSAHREGCEAFTPVQLGLTCAKRKSGNKFEFFPFSMYVYPQSAHFQVHSPTLTFLLDAGLSLDRWVKEGVPFSTLQENRDLEISLENRIAQLENALLTSSAGASAGAALRPGAATSIDPPDVRDREFLDHIRRAVREFIKDERTVSTTKGSQPLVIPVESAFRRLLAHTVIAAEFPHLCSYSGPVPSDGAGASDAGICVPGSAGLGLGRGLFVHKEASALVQAQLTSAQESLKAARLLGGPRVLFEEISSRKIPLIAHNSLLDLLHLYGKFFEPIPAEVETFKRKLLDKFPVIFDTKYIVEQESLGVGASGGLGNIVDMLHTEGKLAEFEIDCRSSYRVNTPQAHDAGYDSLLTALLFASTGAGGTAGGGGFQGSSGANKLKLTRTAPNFLDLQGTSASVDRAVRFAVTGIPEDLGGAEGLVRIFAPVQFEVENFKPEQGEAVLRVGSAEAADELMRMHKVLTPQWGLRELD